MVYRLNMKESLRARIPPRNEIPRPGPSGQHLAGPCWHHDPAARN